MAGKTVPARTAFAPPQGHPPSIEQRPVEQLQVDPNYQRSTEAQDSRAAIRRIAEQWDWRLCAPLTVSRRVTDDGGAPAYYVIDGQHRLEAARMRADIPYLPCIISTFATIAEEAACFVAVNTKRKAISPVATFRAAIAAGDPAAIQVQQLLAEAGLRVATTTNPNAWRAGEFSAVAGVRSAIRRHGEQVARAALVGVGAAFAGQVLRYAGRILQGAYEIYAKPPLGFDPVRFRRMLGARSQADWHAAMLRRQGKHGELAETAMYHALLDAYLAAIGKAA